MTVFLDCNLLHFINIQVSFRLMQRLLGMGNMLDEWENIIWTIFCKCFLEETSSTCVSPWMLMANYKTASSTTTFQSTRLTETDFVWHGRCDMVDVIVANLLLTGPYTSHICENKVIHILLLHIGLKVHFWAAKKLNQTNEITTKSIKAKWKEHKRHTNNCEWSRWWFVPLTWDHRRCKIKLWNRLSQESEMWLCKLWYNTR